MFQDCFFAKYKHAPRKESDTCMHVNEREWEEEKELSEDEKRIWWMIPWFHQMEPEHQSQDARNF